MKVSELMRFLENCDEDAEVILVTQVSFPFENTLHHAMLRQELEFGPDNDGLGSEDDYGASEISWLNGGRAQDVLLVEGTQLRYGNKDCFVR